MKVEDVKDQRNCMFCTREWCNFHGKDSVFICLEYFPYLMPWNTWTSNNSEEYPKEASYESIILRYRWRTE